MDASTADAFMKARLGNYASGSRKPGAAGDTNSRGEDVCANWDTSSVSRSCAPRPCGGRCDRRIIADYLLLLADEFVFHIIGADRIEPARMRAAARLAGGRFVGLWRAASKLIRVAEDEPGGFVPACHRAVARRGDGGPRPALTPLLETNRAVRVIISGALEDSVEVYTRAALTVCGAI
jgi:hypothetical protein